MEFYCPICKDKIVVNPEIDRIYPNTGTYDMTVYFMPIDVRHRHVEVEES